MPKPLPSIERLRQLLDYDPLTGVLTWRPRPFPDNGWNARYAGKPAGCLHSTGYIKVAIDHTPYWSQRVIWKWVHGTEPREVDHDNGVRDDNRLVNLNASSRGGNMRNCKRREDNTSGTTGVHWCRRSQRWVAEINAGGHRSSHRFISFNDAVDARKKAEQTLGFNPNHGREATA